MLSLVFIGIRLEQQFGFVRVGIIYLLSGLGGSILSSLFIQRNISVGASGAVFGLLGAMLSELLTNWIIYTNKAAALFTLVVIIATNLAVGILPHVDNFAHIGGFLVGFLLGFVFLLRSQFGWMERQNVPAEARVKSKHKAYQYVYLLVALDLLIVGLEKLRALEWSKVVQGHQGWRLVTCIWLHAGVIHLLANMLSLVFIGIRLEQQFGFGMLCSFLLLDYKLVCISNKENL